jgi:hypothetical protein
MDEYIEGIDEVATVTAAATKAILISPVFYRLDSCTLIHARYFKDSRYNDSPKVCLNELFDDLFYL